MAILSKKVISISAIYMVVSLIILDIIFFFFFFCQFDSHLVLIFILLITSHFHLSFWRSSLYPLHFFLLGCLLFNQFAGALYVVDSHPFSYICCTSQCDIYLLNFVFWGESLWLLHFNIIKMFPMFSPNGFLVFFLTLRSFNSSDIWIFFPPDGHPIVLITLSENYLIWNGTKTTH